MLSIQPQDLPQFYNYEPRSISYSPPTQMPFLTGTDNCSSSFCSASLSDHHKMNMHYHHHHSQQPTSTSVAQALEIARESPDGASDPTISSILERALAQLWSKVEAEPESYVLTRDEFAVFNYFQHRFLNNPVAREARCRYWNNTSA